MSDKTDFELPQPAYKLSIDDVAQYLQTDLETGLTTDEAERRHAIVGLNALDGNTGVSIIKVFVRQVANALTLVFLIPASC
jgi:P-type Na+/K+ transporter